MKPLSNIHYEAASTLAVIAASSEPLLFLDADLTVIAASKSFCASFQLDPASIFGQTSPSGVPVVINSNNKLGTATSSKRFKENIKPMDKASEALFSLKPVAFRYKKEIDLQGIPQFGLVAEDVEKVNPDLVVRENSRAAQAHAVLDTAADPRRERENDRMDILLGVGGDASRAAMLDECGNGCHARWGLGRLRDATRASAPSSEAPARAWLGPYRRCAMLDPAVLRCRVR